MERFCRLQVGPSKELILRILEDLSAEVACLYDKDFLDIFTETTLIDYSMIGTVSTEASSVFDITVDWRDGFLPVSFGGDKRFLSIGQGQNYWL